MEKVRLKPDFIFESSWEVCNKVGGIYTVLSTRANTLQTAFPDRIAFIGPDVWAGKNNPLFIQDDSLWKEWRESALADGIHVRVGRWNIPGMPCVILVDFQPYYAQKDEIYKHAWEDFGVDSLHAYGDYDEASMFSYAAALVVEHFYLYNLSATHSSVIYHVNEWMTCLGGLYINKHLPQIGTIFTTHATTIGRSIAGNHKPLYEYLWAYNGTQMAQELNVQSKHSIERQAALYLDCFTTVSEVTGRECAKLLDKPCDQILMNGFESDFVPVGAQYNQKRDAARKRIFQVANALIGTAFSDDTLIVSTSGRYEYKNKGLDVFVESVARLLYDNRLQKQVLALIQVPAWVFSVREDLKERLMEDKEYTTPLIVPNLTHWLHEPQNDPILRTLEARGVRNEALDKVKVVFVPCYLDGKDGVFNLEYYDMLIGSDLAVYPSYYEPWGYTPLEAVAFHVPCITTSLSGFGAWVNHVKGTTSVLEDGVEVVSRNDYDTMNVIQCVVEAIVRFSGYNAKKVTAIRNRAAKLSEKALWKHFISYYYSAYDRALYMAKKRMLGQK